MPHIVTWFDLPQEAVLRIFYFLDDKDLCRCAQVSTSWQSFAEREELWKLLSREKQIAFVDTTKKPKEQYKEWHHKFLHCRSVYPKMKKLYDRLMAWLPSDHDFHFNKGATPEDILEFNKTISKISSDPSFSLPLDMHCWYLMANGQKERLMGLFGGYSYYNSRINLNLMSLKQVVSLYTEMLRHKISVFSGLLPFVRAHMEDKWYYLVVNPKLQPALNCNKYEIAVYGDGCNFPLAESFYALLADHVRNLESGNYRIHRDGYINLFPCNNIPVAITKCVKIQASPLFIHERSSAGKKYLWAYSITMSMEPDVPKGRFDCQLLTRHWDIESAGSLEHVDGPGVVGMYPKISPGVVFQYESCCPLITPTGTMGGSFQMKGNNGEVFDAVVPTFTFTLPEKILEPKAEDEEFQNKAEK